MCSVSWLLDQQGYQIFFNRDEQKTRPQALPPQRIDRDGMAVLMPIDPVGQGSWISMNAAGLSLCLLNNYQGKSPNGTLVSRGQLLKDLSGLPSQREVEDALRQTSQQQYAPYTLLAFERGQKQVLSFHWDGLRYRTYPMESPHFSSAVELESVYAYRQQVFADVAAKDRETLVQLHRHHHRKQPHMSVCMHRADAQTVSFTHVQVTASCLQMSYVPGSPCQHLTDDALARHRYVLSDEESITKEAV